MNKQILTRINNLISHIEDLLENNLDIRRELVRIKTELFNPDVLEDINGIRVYKGACFTDEPERIKIGEEIDKETVFEEKEELDCSYSHYIIQDCAGNIIPVNNPPYSLPSLINATFSVSNN